ncbi:PucR C-terminal helix-turn-helix domain-containing protein [Acetitomaculum ruminis DSM 5522]|uniref:PucR C-terminal helix-turn-helix domain-containing protein n=1 Tax=Acetitomaculum ruminis DSM 5522 TaxID=1120918 RepID=A0A1I0W0X5_9FIRM|nr:helix-turn-helix domain-containing protein [Acetitomaculum ruminis]SFA82174.1 PucR C-terminal helix-turn-helix domain-containing protein [Acetitomaculum ruminis DSM 5522]
MSIDFYTISKLVNERELTISSNPSKILLNFVTMEPRQVLSSDYFYATKASTLKKNKHLENMSILVYENVELTAEYYQIPGLNLIVTKDVDSFNQLKDEIQTLFDEQAVINNCAGELMLLCHNNAGIDELLKIAQRFLHNPLLLVDSSYVLISSSGIYKSITDPVINYALKNKSLPENYIKSPDTSFKSQPDKMFPDSLCHEEITMDGKISHIISCPVTRGRHLLGYIKLIESSHEITFVEKNLLIIICGFASISINNNSLYSYDVNVEIEDFLTDILSLKITGNEAISGRTSILKLEEKSELYAVVVKYSLSRSATKRLYHIKNHLHKLFDITTITIYEHLLVMVVPADVFKEKSKNFSAFLTQNELIAGVSLPFNSYSKLFMYYNQALACLDFSSQFDKKEAVLYYNDWKFTHLLTSFASSCDLKDLIPESVFILKKYDETHGTNLLDTLFVYIHSSQNITDSASKMHLHYNTMKYRITQIIELTDINFENYEYVFSLMIAEKVMSLLRIN